MFAIRFEKRFGALRDCKCLWYNARGVGFYVASNSLAANVHSAYRALLVAIT